MRNRLLIILMTALLLPGCAREELDALWKNQEEQARRLANLEAWQKTVNENITSLRIIVQGLQDKDLVTGVIPLADGTGYCLFHPKSIPVFQSKSIPF